MTFQPKYSTLETMDGVDASACYVKHWRINWALDNYVWIFTDRDLKFARQSDCQLACDELNDSGVTIETIADLSDDELGRMVCKRLAW